ncbi:MAG: S8 family serine peptidase [Candidatus Baltobacteraceae bacterium]
MKSPARSAALCLVLIGSLFAAGCGGGGGGSNPPPTPTPTATPPPNPEGCPTSGVSPQSSGGSARIGGLDAVRRMPQTTRNRPEYVPGVVSVQYDRASMSASRTTASAAEMGVGAQLVREYDFSHLGIISRVVSVDPNHLQSAIAKLQASPGVKSVGRVAYRYASAAAPYFPNDPYFNGFPAGSTTPATYRVPPYEEAANVPGQWDMHVIGMANTWGLGAQAQGSSSVKIAIIDTGADLTHLELSGGKVAYAKCFLTPSGSSQTTSQFVPDNDGHGTDVAGIAAGATNNALGFAGAGFNSSFMIYKVFPLPPAVGCPPQSTDALCGADDADISAAVTDAVNNGARVINLSLGGPTGGSILDTAVENAIAAGVVVVAAAGNETAATLDFPAADPGVIAVGASALNDTGAPFEYVAGYSNYSSANPATWGIIAPGGDPSSDTDNDDLHWIENIYTSNPIPLPAGYVCNSDFQSSGAPDCRILIAGTSQATPHVAGAAALLIGAGASASTMKTLLCSNADNINDPKQGCGRLNVYKAMAQTLGQPATLTPAQ